MKLSEFETILKNNFPKWDIEVYDKTARFTLKDCWSEENQIHSNDLEYIRLQFGLTYVTVKNKICKWERNSTRIESIIDINHSLKFEKEEWEE